MSLKKSRFIKGIILAPDSVALDGVEGEIKVDSSTGKIQVTLKDGVNPSASREIVTSSQTQTLTNKTLTSPVLDTGVSGSAIDIDGTLAANSDTKLASQKAVKTYVDAAVASKDQASEISYSNATSGLTATNVQTAIDEVDGNVDNLVTLSGVALDSTTLGTFTGTTIPDSSTIKSAIQSLETSHESHTGASSGVHGVAGSVVGTSDSQALTNKTIDADLNTISNIENADIKVGAAIARAKLASGTANRVVVNDATGVQVDAAAITASRALISDANGIPTHSSTTSTEIGHLSGVTSAIQTQLDGKVDESGGTLTSGSIITPARLDVKQGTKAELVSYAALPTTTNGQIVYAIDTKEMFQVIDGLLEGIGGGEGVGGTDILFAQTFETAALTDFTQTGLSLSTSSPLHGEISALLTHQAGVSPTNDQSFKQVIAVDNKFRNQTMVLRLDVKSNASAGNVVINIYDETNAANIVASEQLQLSNDVNGTKNSVGFTIPETCASLSYTITALPEAGSPVTRIDDIICELAETALLETAVEVPNVTSWQGYTPTFQGFGSPTNIEFEWRQVGENVEIRGKFNSGAPTAVEARIGLPAGLTSAGTSLIPSIQFAGKGIRGIGVTNNIKTHVVLIEPSVSYVTFGMDDKDEPNNPFTKLVGSSVILSGESYSFTTSVPCSGLSATTTKTIPLTQSGLVQEADSSITVYTGAGFGSTNTTVRRFSIISQSIGSDILYQDSDLFGASFTVKESGIYHISYTDRANTGTTNIYLLKNTITNSNREFVLGTEYIGNGTGSQLLGSVSWSGYLLAGDIIRAGCDNPATVYNLADTMLTISKQGSLKQIAVSSDQKLRIPTSELRFEGASSRGSTATVIVKFDTIAKLRGDAFTVESDSVLGTRITMKKAGLLNVNASCAVTTGSSYLMITKNLTSLTVTPSVPSEIISASQVYATTAVTNVTGNLYVNVGDIIRIAATGVPAGDTRNVLNLSFQEQDIAVSVTNTLPQFSESDTYFRLNGFNTLASTTTQGVRLSSVLNSTGNSVSYIDDDAYGATFNILESGTYDISAILRRAGGTEYADCFITVNEITNLAGGATATPVSVIARTAVASNTQDISNNTASAQVYLTSGDKVRVQLKRWSGSSVIDNFTISKVGKPNVTGVDVTPFVKSQLPESQTISTNGTVTTSFIDSVDDIRFNTSVFFKSGSSLINIVDDSVNGSTRFIALKNCKVVLSFMCGVATAGNVIQIKKNGVVLTFSSEGRASPSYIQASQGIELFTGDYITIQVGTISASYGYSLTILAEALSDQILTAPETFSTDTASLTYASDAIYTLSTLQNAPVGTYITFTYAANTNTRTQTSTRPTQTDADMNTNGILLYTRAYNAASSGAQPAAIAIQIGKGMKGKSLDLYKSASKVTTGSLDLFLAGGDVVENGIRLKEYNEITGILLIDAGIRGGACTVAQLNFSDITAQTSGYLVINASKSPALTGVPLIQPRIATLSDVKASGTNGGTATSGSYQTRTLNTLSDPTGIITSLASNQFTLPAGEYYIEAESSASFVNGHKAKLRNITDSVDTLIGTVEFSSSAAVYASTPSRVKGNVVISSSKVFEIQHRVETTRATNGFGIATASFGDNELYTIVKITKVK